MCHREMYIYISWDNIIFLMNMFLLFTNYFASLAFHFVALISLIGKVNISHKKRNRGQLCGVTAPHAIRNRDSCREIISP